MEGLTYEEYAAMGGSADEAAFPMLEARARRIVDVATHGRLNGESPLRESVRYCLTQLIDTMAADGELSAGTGREVTQVHNDGVSLTFVAGTEAARAGSSAAVRNARIVREWLSGEADGNGVHLLYAGVDA